MHFKTPPLQACVKVCLASEKAIIYSVFVELRVLDRANEVKKEV